MAPINSADTIASGTPSGIVTLNPGGKITNEVQYYRFNNDPTVYKNSLFGSNNTPVINPTPIYSAPIAPIATPAPVATPPITTPTPTQASIYSPAASYTGSSVSDFLKTAGQANDYNSRAKLAAQYGINGYAGTAAQNTQLLNILKGYATGNVNNLGVPNAVATTDQIPTPGTPIDSSQLGFDTTTDIGKILAAAVGKGTISSDIAGLLALQGQDSAGQKQYDDLTSKLTELMGSLGNEGADLQKELDANGVSDSYNHVKELNLKAAQLQGELQSFDAETLQEQSNIEGQAIPQGLIRGQTAALSKQRDLTRIAKAAELAGTVALSQAYQGNATLGLDLASKSVDLKYQPILAQIDTLKTQISIAGDKMSKDDAKRASVISSLLTIKQNEIEQEKADQKDIQSLAVQAAVNGAPLATVNQIKAAPTATDAAVLASKWVKGNLETTGSGSTTPSVAKVKFTPSDIQSLVGTGLSNQDVTNLQNDINNHGVDMASAGLTAAQKRVLGNLLGVSLNKEQFLSKDYFKDQFGAELEKAAKDAGFEEEKKSGGLLGTGVFAKTYKQVNTDGYLDQLMKSVQQYRNQGYTDEEILKLMQ